MLVSLLPLLRSPPEKVDEAAVVAVVRVVAKVVEEVKVVVAEVAAAALVDPTTTKSTSTTPTPSLLSKRADRTLAPNKLYGLPSTPLMRCDGADPLS
jgi:hypothetical protein